MTKDEALKLALKALKHTHPSALTSFYTIGDRDKAIKAIQEHLAQPEPWEKFCDSNCVWTDHHPDCKLAERLPLTDEEIRLQWSEFWETECHPWAIEFARAIEAAHGIKGEA